VEEPGHAAGALLGAVNQHPIHSQPDEGVDDHEKGHREGHEEGPLRTAFVEELLGVHFLLLLLIAVAAATKEAFEDLSERVGAEASAVVSNKANNVTAERQRPEEDPDIERLRKLVLKIDLRLGIRLITWLFLVFIAVFV
jgi:hypothetical protein